MPTQFIATAAAAFLFTVHFAEPVAAQYHHDYRGHHGGVHGRAHDYHHAFDYHAGHYQDYGDHAHYQDNYYLGHGGLDAYCPATSVCPLQYQPHSAIGSPSLGDRTYQNIPFNNAPAYDERNSIQPHDHTGHDHSGHNHDHDGHSHAAPLRSPDAGYIAPPSLSPSDRRQPSPPPSFDSRSRQGQPSQQSAPIQDSDSSIKMDGPPPAL